MQFLRFLYFFAEIIIRSIKMWGTWEDSEEKVTFLCQLVCLICWRFCNNSIVLLWKGKLTNTDQSRVFIWSENNHLYSLTLLGRAVCKCKSRRGIALKSRLMRKERMKGGDKKTREGLFISLSIVFVYLLPFFTSLSSFFYFCRPLFNFFCVDDCQSAEAQFAFLWAVLLVQRSCLLSFTFFNLHLGVSSPILQDHVIRGRFHCCLHECWYVSPRMYWYQCYPFPVCEKDYTDSQISGICLSILNIHNMYLSLERASKVFASSDRNAAQGVGIMFLCYYGFGAWKSNSFL